MIVYKNKEFRNLQEQVYKNMSDIANLKSSGIVLDEFGIKVVGQESSVANMPTVADYKENNPDWAYGDAYAIGTEPPYDLYILTREDANHVEDYWFNIGEFPAPGPQGEQGETGATGPQGPTGPSGADGLSAGFGLLTATAVTLQPNEQATVTVTEDGPNTAKNLSFTFGIPKGEKGESASVEWGDITGDISDQTDLVNTLQTKQNTLVSGTNIKTINNTSILGSGNITISGSKPEVSDFTEGTGISISEDSVNDTVEIAVDTTVIPTISSLATVATSGSYADLSNKPTIPTKVSDLTNDSGYITSSALSGYATETWVTSQGYAESADLATVATSGSYNDLSDKPTIPVVDYPVTDVQVNSISVVNQSGVAEIDLTDYVESSDLATVATTGDYDDLIDKPSIPAVSGTNDGTNWTSITINSDTYSIPSGTGTITDVEVNGTSVVTAGVAEITVPTVTSDLTNDSGFITSSALTGYAQLSAGTSSSKQEFTGWNSFVHNLTVKSGSGTAYMEYTYSQMNRHTSAGDTYGYVFPLKSGTVAMTSDIPTTTSALTNDSGFITSSALSDYVTTNTNQTISGVKTFAAEGIKIRGQDLGNVSLKGPLVNNAYVATFPSKSGTIAMTSDIPSLSDYALLAGGDSINRQIFTGYNQFNNWIKVGSSPSQSFTYYCPNSIINYDANGNNYSILIPNKAGTIALTSDISVTDVEVNGTSIVNSGVAELTSETWTFTLSDGTTTTKKILVG